MTASDPLLLSGVCKTMAGHSVLRDVGFRVLAGSITALVGANGAGKTTCVSIATGLRRADRGQAVVCGVLSHEPPARLLSSVVPQEIGFPAAVRAEHCLRYAAGQRPDRGLSPAAAEVTDLLDLTSAMHRRTGALSGGQQRKLAIAMALVHAPPLVILDEATTNLDEQTRETTWTLVRHYAERGGAALVTSHILADIDANAHRVVGLDGGRVVLDEDLPTIRHRLGGSVVSVRLRTGEQSSVVDRVRLLGLGTVLPFPEAETVVWRSQDPLRLLAAVAAAGVRATDVTVRPVSLREVLHSLTAPDPLVAAPDAVGSC